MNVFLIVFGSLAGVCIILGILAIVSELYDGGSALIVLAVIFLIALAITGGKCAQAKNEATLLNARYGTSYTAEQVFWSRSTIFGVLEGPRQRIDGDLNINME